MAAPKGHKRYGGRQKGSVNKSKSDVKEILDNVVDFEKLFEKLYDLAMGKKQDTAAAKILLEYRFGKPLQSIQADISDLTIKIIRE